MSDEKTVFEFQMRATLKDLSGYYHPRWDRAQNITARGSTKQEAVNSAAKVLGTPERGWGWIFYCDDIKEVSAG